MHMTLPHDAQYNDNHNLHVILITSAIVHSAISKSHVPLPLVATALTNMDSRLFITHVMHNAKRK